MASETDLFIRQRSTILKREGENEKVRLSNLSTKLKGLGYIIRGNRIIKRVDDDSSASGHRDTVVGDLKKGDSRYLGLNKTEFLKVSPGKTWKDPIKSTLTERQKVDKAKLDQYSYLDEKDLYGTEWYDKDIPLGDKELKDLNESKMISAVSNMSNSLKIKPTYETMSGQPSDTKPDVASYEYMSQQSAKTNDKDPASALQVSQRRRSDVFTRGKDGKMLGVMTRSQRRAWEAKKENQEQIAKNLKIPLRNWDGWSGEG